MLELLMISVGGLLGSAHCVGMCGGFGVIIGCAYARLASQSGSAGRL